MNRASRRANNSGGPNTLNGQLVGRALSVINKEIRKFILDILADCNVNADKIFYKIELEDMCYKIVLCDGETGNMIGHAWSLNEFLELCSNKRLEFILNTVIRQMILALDDKRTKDSDGNIITTWI